MTTFATVNQYIGRVVDVMPFQGVEPVGEQLLEQAFFNEKVSGTACTGIQKLAVRWTIEFLTVQGSMPYLPSRGTPFLTEVTAGRVLSEVDVFALFSFSQTTLERNMENEDGPDTPDDERLDRAELISVELIPDLLKLFVRITSRAGDQSQLILPINVTPVI